MLEDMLVLIGLGLFIRVFFDSAKQIKEKTNVEQRKKKIVKIGIHVGLGLLFIIIARLYVSS